MINENACGEQYEVEETHGGLTLDKARVARVLDRP
jgi:hypothetical protein